MKAEWNTPPNGDFARYVETLTAQAARNLGRGQTDVTGEHGLDVGMTQTAGPGAVVAAPSAGRAAATRAKASAEQGKGLFGALTKPILGAIGIALVFLWSLGVPVFALVVLAALAFWFGAKFKSIAFPGAAKWQQVLEEANARAKQLQQGKPSK